MKPINPKTIFASAIFFLKINVKPAPENRKPRAVLNCIGTNPGNTCINFVFKVYHPIRTTAPNSTLSTPVSNTKIFKMDACLTFARLNEFVYYQKS